jgi:hypothetical protein
VNHEWPSNLYIHKLLSTIELLLYRSQLYPLSVQLHEVDGADAHKLMNAIMPSALRWHVVDIRVHPTAFEGLLNSPDLSNLHELILHISDTGFMTHIDAGELDLHGFLQNTSNIHDLILLSSSPSHRSLELPCTDVLRQTLLGVILGAFTEVIRLAPRLEKLDLEFVFDSRGPRPPEMAPEPTTLPQLRQLRIYSDVYLLNS